MNRLSFLILLFLFILQGCGTSYLDGQDFSLNHRPIPTEANLVQENNIELSLIEISSLSPQVLDSMPRISGAKIPADLRNINFDNYIENSYPNYIIGPGDIIKIRFPSDNNVERITSQGLKVNSVGEIEFPYLGKYKISGFTPSEAQELLKTALENLYVNPQIYLSIQEFRSNKAFISGSFGESTGAGIKTRVLTLDDVPMTVIQALDKIGVTFNESTPNPFAVLKRENKNHIIDLGFITNNANPNIYIKNNDFIYLPGTQNQKVYITGEVVADQVIDFRSTMTLSEVLMNSGINKIRANLEEVYVIRVNQNVDNKMYGTAYRVNIKNPTGYILADKFHLLDKDILFVSTNKIDRWNQTMSRVLSSLDFMNLWRSYKPVNSNVFRTQ